MHPVQGTKKVLQVGTKTFEGSRDNASATSFYQLLAEQDQDLAGRGLVHAQQNLLYISQVIVVGMSLKRFWIHLTTRGSATDENVKTKRKRRRAEGVSVRENPKENGEKRQQID